MSELFFFKCNSPVVVKLFEILLQIIEKFCRMFPQATFYLFYWYLQFCLSHSSDIKIAVLRPLGKYNVPSQYTLSSVPNKMVQNACILFG